jgi:hypothetical protein
VRFGAADIAASHRILPVFTGVESRNAHVNMPVVAWAPENYTTVVLGLDLRTQSV